MIRPLLIVCIIGCVFGMRISPHFITTGAVPPSPPSIITQFRSNFSVSIVDEEFGNVTTFFTGFVALDYVTGGGLVTVGGEEIVPIYFHTNFISSPDPEVGNITGYIFQGDLCMNVGSVPIEWLIMFPLEIPYNATFVGYQTINGERCSGWEWYSGYDFDNVTVWVSTTDFSLVQIDFGGVEYLNAVQWNFFNTITGPFNPKIYNPPSQICETRPMSSTMKYKPKSLLKSMLTLITSLGY